MKRKILLILVILSIFLIENIFAQINFQKTYGGSSYDDAYCVKQTYDGGYIISGSTSSYGVGPDDIYILRTDKYGNILWTKTYGKVSGSFLGAYGKIVEQTNDSGFVIACYDFLPNGNGWSALIIKTNNIGDTLWTRNFGGVGGSLEPYSIEQTNDGGYIIGTLGPGGVSLIKTDSYGDTIWTNKIGVLIWGQNYSGFVRQTKDGGYICASTDYTFSSKIDFVLAKTDSLGNVLWSNVYGTLGDDILKSVQQTSDGGYIIGGYTNGFGAGGKDAYLIKTDSLGVVSWSRTYGSSMEDFADCVQQTIDGGYIIGGRFDNNVCMIKTDSTGLLIWSNHFLKSSGYFYESHIEQTSDSGFIISNSTMNWMLGSDFYLIKTDVNGNSGCYQNSFTTTISSPPTFTSAKTFNYSAGCSINNYALQISSGGSITQSCLTIGFDEPILSNIIKVFPNPTSNFLTIDLISNIKTEIKIFNALGKLEYSLIGNQDRIKIDVSFLMSGIYFLEINDKKNISRMKFIKQ